MIDTQRISDGKTAKYVATVTCDGCRKTLAEEEAPLAGRFLEDENLAHGRAVFAATSVAAAAGATVQEANDHWLCLACAPADRLAPGQTRILTWFLQSPDGTGAPGIRFDRAELAALVTRGLLTPLDARTWQLSLHGYAALGRAPKD